MELLKKYWKFIVIGVILFALGVIISSALKCKRSDGTSYHESIDSLKSANELLNVKYAKISDSIGAVVQMKEETNKVLANQLDAVTAKYIRLRNSKPNIDTVVKVHEVLIGAECIEKMPILQTQLINCQSENTDLHNLVKVKTDYGMALQNQLGRSLMINDNQLSTIKKLERKRRALKIWATISTVGCGALVISTLIVK